MQASTKNGACLRALSEILKEFHDSVNIMYTPEGMSASGFDHNNIALINFNIPAQAFDRYICQGNYVACLNMNVLHNVLKAVGAAKSALTMRIDPEHLNVMQILIWNSDLGTTAVHTLKLWAFSTDHLDIPNSTFDFYVEMPSAHFQRSVNHLSTLMNNEDKNKRIEVLVDSSGTFELAVEGEFGCGRLKIGTEQAGVKMHERPADPMSDEFGMPEPEDEVLCDDEGSDDSEEEGDDDDDDEENDDDAAAHEEAVEDDDDGGDDQDDEEYAPRGGGHKRKKAASSRASAKQPAKRSKKATAKVAKVAGGGGFVPPPDRGSVIDEAERDVEAERVAAARPPVREYFNIKYVKSIAKAVCLSSTVLIFIRKGFPMIFVYRIGTMGKLCFCLAPAKPTTAAGAAEITDDDNDAEATTVGDDDGEIVDDAEAATVGGGDEAYDDGDDDDDYAANGDGAAAHEYEEDFVPQSASASHKYAAAAAQSRRQVAT